MWPVGIPQRGELKVDHHSGIAGHAHRNVVADHFAAGGPRTGVPQAGLNRLGPAPPVAVPELSPLHVGKGDPGGRQGRVIGTDERPVGGQDSDEPEQAVEHPAGEGPFGAAAGGPIADVFGWQRSGRVEQARCLRFQASLPACHVVRIDFVALGEPFGTFALERREGDLRLDCRRRVTAKFFSHVLGPFPGAEFPESVG
jgi:hypothetical protein